MPVRKAKSKSKAMKGAGFLSALSKANNWLRGNRAISKIANAVASTGVPGVSQLAGKIGSTAGSYGYGRKGKGRKTVIKV
jgi:hypothetical protein